MKDKIEKILNDNLMVSGSGMSIWGKKGASAKLTALMCYREVRAYLHMVEEKDHWPSYSKMLEYFGEDYTGQDIRSAVEQVKNEMTGQ